MNSARRLARVGQVQRERDRLWKPKPGDVAAVTNRHGVENVAICGVAPGGFLWRYGVADAADAVDDPSREARPLVLIDPRDRDVWIRIAQHIGSVVAGPGDDISAIIAAVGDILDDLAWGPPPPVEPMNYLAVVETWQGLRYWRWAAGTMHTATPWRLLGSVHVDTEAEDGNFRWEDLRVVSVVSEGVPA